MFITSCPHKPRPNGKSIAKALYKPIAKSLAMAGHGDIAAIFPAATDAREVVVYRSSQLLAFIFLCHCHIAAIAAGQADAIAVGSDTIEVTMPQISTPD